MLNAELVGTLWFYGTFIGVILGFSLICNITTTMIYELKQVWISIGSVIGRMVARFIWIGILVIFVLYSI